MKNYPYYLSVLFLFTAQLTYAMTNCPTVDCNCEALTSNSWKELCIARELKLNKSCKEPQGNCIVHGPLANRPSLVIDIETIGAEHFKGIQLLNHKLAAMYWSTQQDMSFIDNNISTSEFLMAEQRLKLMLFNSETLMNIQRQLASLLEESSTEIQISRSWHNFGDQITELSQHLLASANTLLEKSKLDKEVKKLALAMLSAAGDLFEQVAYAYDHSAQQQQASAAWKKAATISSKILAIAENDGDKENIDYYRYQSATRLHRASANAKDNLAEN